MLGMLGKVGSSELSPVPLLILCLAVSIALAGCSSFPLLHASAEGDREQVVKLLDEGMDVNGRSPFVRTTPLILAAWNNHIDTVRLLLDRKADVNAKDITGWTALHAAAFGGHTEIMQLLLERGAVRSESRWVSYRPSRWADKGDHQVILELMKRGE
jgi:ankyrin repeat protein